LPFADVIDGRLMAIPRAIFAAAAALSGARGGVNIPAEDVDAVKRKIAAYYKRLGETPPWSTKSKGGMELNREEIVAAVKEAVQVSVGGLGDVVGEAIRTALKEAKQDAGNDDGQAQDQKDQQSAPESKDQDADDNGKKDDEDKKDGDNKDDDVVQLSREEYEALVNRVKEIESAVGKARGFGLFFGSNRLNGQDDDQPATKRKYDRDMFGRVIKRKNAE